jgi:hypothetical protein
MMAKQIKVLVNVKFSWWIFVYLNTLTFFCATFNVFPNLDKVEYWIRKSIKIKSVKIIGEPQHGN